MLKRNWHIFCILITGFLLLTSCNNKKLNQLNNNDIVVLSGQVSIIGNMPFSKYALTVHDHHYSIALTSDDPSIQSFIKTHLGKSVIITGKVIINEMKSSDLKYSMKDYSLLVTKIKPNQ